MDVNLTSDQQLFVETARRFVDSAFPLTAVRERLGVGGAEGPDYRRKAAELGWFAMVVPEALGGGSVSDNGVLDAALVGFVRGAALQPGSFVGTNVVAWALSRAEPDDRRRAIVEALVSGDASATWAVGSGGAQWDPVAGVEAHRRGAGWVLTGSKTAVQDAEDVDWLLVSASSAHGAIEALVSPEASGVRVQPLEGLDLTRRFCEVHFDDVEVPALDVLADLAPGALTHQLDLACVLTVAESTGAMEHDFALALQYAKDRIAFGRPIGSFQAVKHLLADTSLMLETSKAVAQAAARALGSDDPDASSKVSMAKAFVGDCAIDLAQNCFQVFGGIGYTWEHDQHLYLRRLTTDAALYGDPAWHRERLCRLGGL